MSAPTKTTPGYRSDAAESTGSSCAQGPHHEAQKLSTTGRPRYAEMSTLLPDGRWISSAGAAWPRTCGLVKAACWRPQPSENISTAAATAAPPVNRPVLSFNLVSLVH